MITVYKKQLFPFSRQEFSNLHLLLYEGKRCQCDQSKNMKHLEIRLQVLITSCLRCAVNEDSTVEQKQLNCYRTHSIGFKSGPADGPSSK